MQPFPYPSDATHKIWSRLANWLQRFSSLKVWTTTDDDDGRLVYYKLTLWAFGSGELKRQKTYMYLYLLILELTGRSTANKDISKHGLTKSVKCYGEFDNLHWQNSKFFTRSAAWGTRNMSGQNTEFNDLRKIICLRKIVSDFSKLALVCRMQISGAWHALHDIAEMEWVEQFGYHSN